MSGFLWFNHTNDTPGRRFNASLAAVKSHVQGDFVGINGEQEQRNLQQLLKAKNDAFLKLREVSSDSVQDDKFLTSLSVQYANDEYIGLMLMPHAPVPQISGLYPIYNEESRFEGPDDEMLGRSEANEIDEGDRDEGTYKCKPRALKNVLDWVTMQNAAAPLNEMVDLTMALADVVAIKREKRIADVMTTSGNYASSNVIPIAAGDRFDSAGGGDPIGVLQDMNARLWKGRGPARTYWWGSLEVWNVLARHPAILDLSKHTVQGLATPRAVAEYFGWDGVLVSQARRRTSRKGQTATYGRMYGNNMGICRVAVTPNVRNAVFGHTLAWNGVRTRVWFEQKMFTDGAYVAQTAHHEDHKVIANKAGVLVTTPITPF